MRQVHEYSIDRATATARIGATNPIRKYILGQDEAPIIVQLSRGDLHFYDQGGAPMDIDDVPESVLDNLRTNPLRRGNETVEQVLKFCPFCPSNSNAVASGEYEAHLIDHAKRAGEISSRTAEPVEDAPAPAPRKTKAKRK